MMPEPLKSALSLGDVEDTSLALPSERELRSAQQRVLDQVHTIKRSKSKYSSKSVSGLTSPTSPESDSVFYDFKFSPGASLGGPSFNRGGTMTNGNMQRQNIVRKSTKSRSSSGQRGNSGSGRLDRAFYSPTGTLPAQLRTNNQLYSYKATHSAPDLGFQPSANGGATAQRSQSGRQTFRMEKTFSQPNQALGNGTLSRMTNSNQVGTFQGINRRPSSLQSNGESRTSMIRTGQVKDVSGMNTEKMMSDLTMREAVDFLYSPDENYQQCGAAYIQHSTFTDDKAKEEVLTLKGIPPLVNLLSSSSPQIQETVAAALRNAVFKNQANKEEVHRCGGITAAVQLLRDSSSETQKHLTGLLWNLSSADKLKPDLLRMALPVLVEKVIEPFSSSVDDDGDTSLAPEVFCNATGCLRNLSASKLANRQAMRNSKGLIDSLMRYTDSCINAGTPDDQSLENCVCILHNLTYQLETEMPSLFTKINALANARSRSSPSDAGPIGCFSSQSQKLQQESVFDYPVMEDNNPKGAGWLFHSKALQMYLRLLNNSERDATLEASCGALQNLTANDGLVSDVLSHTIVQKLSGLRYISPFLQSSNPALQNSAVALVGNLSRSTRTYQSMARQTLPQLFGFLHSGLDKNDTSAEYDSTMATALHSAQTLLKADPDIGKSLLNNSLVNSLHNMSLNMGLPKSSTAAGVFLHSMWSEKNIQTFLKKQGMNKKFFVNDTTSAAFKSLQVID